MLEFLGFIALIAIIFGVSFSTALVGFLKVIVIGFAVIMALGIILKMLESKAGAWLVLAGSAIAIYLGVIGINTDFTQTYRTCDSLIGTSFMGECLLSNTKEHDEIVNRGWAYAICGGLATLASCVSLADFYNEESLKKKSTPKKH